MTHRRINPQEDLKNACPSGLSETADGSLNRNHWFGKMIWRYLIRAKVNTSSHAMTQSRGAGEIHAPQTTLLGREQDLSVTPPATRRAVWIHEDRTCDPQRRPYVAKFMTEQIPAAFVVRFMCKSRVRARGTRLHVHEHICAGIHSPVGLWSGPGPCPTHCCSDLQAALCPPRKLLFSPAQS